MRSLQHVLELGINVGSMPFAVNFCLGTWNSAELACSFFFYLKSPSNLHEFSRMKYFEILNSVLTKNIEINASFLGFFISKSFEFNRSTFDEPTKPNWTGFIGFHKNRPVFIGK
jgi:hypothetical protein